MQVKLICPSDGSLAEGGHLIGSSGIFGVATSNARLILVCPEEANSLFAVQQGAMAVEERPADPSADAVGVVSGQIGIQLLPAAIR